MVRLQGKRHGYMSELLEVTPHQSHMQALRSCGKDSLLSILGALSNALLSCLVALETWGPKWCLLRHQLGEVPNRQWQTDSYMSVHTQGQPEPNRRVGPKGPSV